MNEASQIYNNILLTMTLLIKTEPHQNISKIVRDIETVIRSNTYFNIL